MNFRCQKRLSLWLRKSYVNLPARFVVGYGLDYHEDYRHLPFVGELRPELLRLA